MSCLDRLREGSTVLKRGREIRAQLDSAAEGSAFARSRPFVPDRVDLERAFADSKASSGYAAAVAAGRWFRRTAANARLADGGARLRRYATASAGYQWLTTEPATNVIVVDLTETRTVGPVILTLERTVRRLEAAGSASKVADLVGRLASAVRTRSGWRRRLLVYIAILGTVLTAVLAIPSADSIPVGFVLSGSLRTPPYRPHRPDRKADDALERL
ncbi:hypothetical protein [Halopiger djelfimassiliensis]|uniref:hypothetical protein n=1 Tax=Halopiger djelfimassiliensis TaxID=1293047 RepID=UPI0006779468|nr:hypothetical protein [Halopiger djelfimassiliensis]